MKGRFLGTALITGAFANRGCARRWLRVVGSGSIDTPGLSSLLTS
jgi:hypothetical protein